MKIAEEVIRALYNIANAIKGNNGESGGGESSNDNGLMGADAVAVKYGASSKDYEIIDNFTDLVKWVKNTFNDSSYNTGYGTSIRFLYKNDNFDKLHKPTVGEFNIGGQMDNPEINPLLTKDLRLNINYICEETVDDYIIKPFEETDYYYLQID